MKNLSSFKEFLVGILFLSLSSFIFSQEKRPVVTGVNALASSDGKISVSWILPKNSEKQISSFVIYRTSKPVTNYTQLEFIEPLASVSNVTENFSDIVRTSNEYFYTIVTMIYKNIEGSKDSDYYYDEQLNANLNLQTEVPVKLVLPGVNATVEGVKALISTNFTQPSIKKQKPERRKYDNKMREMPLPLMEVLDEEKKSEEPKISDEAKQSIQPLLKTKKETPEVLPIHIFDEDLISPAGGDEYLLFEILKTSFIKKRYSDSIDSLKQFLARNRKKEVADRASFYLGESYYYTGNFPSALTLFLSLEEVYPELCRKWIESTLDNFVIEED